MTFPEDHAALGMATRALVADHAYALEDDVAPPISLSTTFRHRDPDDPTAGEPDPFTPHRNVYSRETQPTLTRAEKVLGTVIGQPTLLYPTGISAAWAALIHYRPDVIAITKGYHGVHGAIGVYCRTRGNVRVIKLEDEFGLQGDEKNLLCWLETPLNPTGVLRDIAFYAEKTHAILGGSLCLDATFAPPPLMDPFKWGADGVMHSTTKYFAGHSDVLGGSLSVRTEEEWKKLHHDRTFTGATPGGFDAWLLLRSLRTLTLRVNRQADTALLLVDWLQSLTTPDAPDGLVGVVTKVWHATLCNPELVGPGRQMEKGSPCFAILMASPERAARFPGKLQIFTNATSLGGVESLIEQRIVSDVDEDPRLVRMSIGLEDFADLKQDLIDGFRKVVAEVSE